MKAGDVVSLGEQIVLVYEALSSDAGATMISHKAPARAASTAVSAPPAQPYRAPAQPAPASSSSGGSRNTAIFIAAGVLVLICVCAAALWYIDANYMWCTFFPFLSGC